MSHNSQLGGNMSKEIEIGDKVTVHFVRSASIFQATVLYRPQDVGDSWRLERAGNITYVQMFERMDLVFKNFKRKED